MRLLGKTFFNFGTAVGSVNSADSGNRIYCAFNVGDEITGLAVTDNLRH